MTDTAPGTPVAPEATVAKTLSMPNDADFRALFSLWEAKRGGRAAPARRDFDPSELRRLLPDIFLVDVLPPPGGYRYRLMGENIVAFYGHNLTGKTFADVFEPPYLGALTALFDAVVAGPAPIFRAGEAYWWRDKSYKTYESCNLPLAADGRTVNMILGAMRFP